jgi:hypothetical protein
MKARHSWYLVLFFSFLSITVLFNNCAPSKGGDETVEEASEPEVEMVKDFSGKLTASFQSVSVDGKAFGYAFDSMNKTAAIKVIFYANGPVGTGVYVGEIVAKESGVGAYAGHYFSYKIPAELANGKTQSLYAYGHEAKPEYLIGKAPKTFISYSPKAEAYFNQYIGPFVNSSCKSCHTWNYQSLFYGPLMSPSPTAGGTKTNNKFIRKMSGLEGHNGGQFCSAGVNSDICVNIQAWWQLEFQ